MLPTCPICQAARPVPVWLREAAPIHQFLPAGGAPRDEDFARLEIVECGRCGHLWNRAFDPAVLDRMYTSEHLTNVPVSAGMVQHLERTLDWIGPEWVAGRTVLEVGGGSGALARMAARSASGVILVEPSRGIGQAAFPEPNIRFLNEMFPPREPLPAAGLAICRQVLEHVPDPGRMVADMAAALRPDGALYLEVPSARYIREQAALFDFHCAHVQYFALANLVRLAALAGLVPLRHQELNGGRDFGVLFTRLGVAAPPAPGAGPAAGTDLGARLRGRQEAYQAWFRDQRGALVLYGATWNGLAFQNAFDAPPAFPWVLDDNPQYAGCALYHRALRVPVAPARGHRFDPGDTVIITAYHHAEGITRRLREDGFGGRILSAAETP